MQAAGPVARPYKLGDGRLNADITSSRLTLAPETRLCLVLPRAPVAKQAPHHDLCFHDLSTPSHQIIAAFLCIDRNDPSRDSTLLRLVPRPNCKLQSRQPNSQRAGGAADRCRLIQASLKNGDRFDPCRRPWPASVLKLRHRPAAASGLRLRGDAPADAVAASAHRRGPAPALRPRVFWRQAPLPASRLRPAAARCPSRGQAGPHNRSLCRPPRTQPICA